MFISFRKGEKWVWYTALGAGGIVLIGQLVLVYLVGSAVDSAFLPASLMLVILWGIGIALLAKEVLNSKK
jgi:hypothetical protein